MGKKSAKKPTKVAAAASANKGPVIAATRRAASVAKATAPPPSIKPKAAQAASEATESATEPADAGSAHGTKRKSRRVDGEPTVIDGTSLPLTTEELNAKADRRKHRREQKAAAAKERLTKAKGNAESVTWKKPLTLLEGMKATIIKGETHAGKTSILSRVMAISERDQTRFVTHVSRPIRLTLGCPFAACDFELDAAYQAGPGKVLPKQHLDLTKTTFRPYQNHILTLLKPHLDIAITTFRPYPKPHLDLTKTTS